MRLTEQEMQARRESMIQAAFQLFCDRGIERVSLAEIARKAQVGENTIYRYFENKDKLVLEAFVKLWDTIMRNVGRLVEDIPDYGAMTGLAQMRAWIDTFRQLFTVDRAFVLFSYEAKLYLLRQKIKLDSSQQDMLMHAFRGPCLAALNKGKADGSIPVQESSENLFYAIWGSVRGYIVKIVIDSELCGADSPWEKRYEVMVSGIISALSVGWQPSGK